MKKSGFVNAGYTRTSELLTGSSVVVALTVITSPGPGITPIKKAARRPPRERSTPAKSVSADYYTHAKDKKDSWLSRL